MGKAMPMLPIEKIETELLKHEQVSCPVTHRFGPGIYIREVVLPKGSLVIGHRQNFEHMNLFLKGHVAMLNEDGTVTEMKAPMSFVGKPGRKIGYIKEDVVWLNVYSTTETDVEKLEAHFLTKSDAFLSAKQNDGIKQLTVNIDRDDFKKAISEIGYDEETVSAQSENESDMIDLPYGTYKFKVSESAIHGKGLIATGEIEPGEIIAPARIGLNRTVAGRFTNHSVNPNAQMFLNRDGGIDLIATKPIKGQCGGMDGEEITIDYRISARLALELNEGEKCQE